MIITYQIANKILHKLSLKNQYYMRELNKSWYHMTLDPELKINKKHVFFIYYDSNASPLRIVGMVFSLNDVKTWINNNLMYYPHKLIIHSLYVVAKIYDEFSMNRIDQGMIDENIILKKTENFYLKN